MDLYKFTIGAINYYYNDGRRTETALGSDWTPIPIKSTEWISTLADSEIQITMPSNVFPASAFILQNPSSVTWLAIYDGASPHSLRFAGKVMSAEFDPKNGVAILKAAAMTSLIKTGIPVRKYSPSCNWEFGDANCGYDLEAAKAVLPLDDAVFDGFKLTHPVIGMWGDAWFTSGYLQTDKSERCYVLAHEDDYIMLLTLPQLPLEDDLWLYPGCDKSFNSCKYWYLNEANFGGFHHVPVKNPVLSGV